MEKTIIARAAELARTGRYPTVAAIRETLRREGYEHVHDHLAGSKIKNDLAALIKATKVGG